MSLVFVPTPLGNLRDITLRALDTLRSCDVIAAEDTRVTRRLLSAHAITGKAIVRYDEHSSPAATASLIERAASQAVVVVTDAGMPGISDPGHELVMGARARGVSVEVLPGPVAFVCAAVLSGFTLAPLVFDGFFPRTAAARRLALQNVSRVGATAVWYESPHRLRSSLEFLAREAPGQRVFVARELTKKFEQHLIGTPAEVLAALPVPLRGEITLVIETRRCEPDAVPAAGDTDIQIDALLDAGKSVAAIAKSLSQSGFGERSELYARATERRRKRRV